MATTSKRLGILLSASVLTLFLTGIPSRAFAGIPIPRYIIMSLVMQAVGRYALPRIEKKMTPKQRQRVAALRQETIEQLESLLTKAQRSQIANNIRANKRVSAVVESLKLTPEQRAKMIKVIQDSRKEMQQIMSE